MTRPNRFLSIATLTTFVVAIALSFFYHYRAINDLQQARLQTDLAISRHLPSAFFSLTQRQNGETSPSVPQQQQLELQVKGLNIIALELQTLQQALLLTYGERPSGELFKDAAGYENAKQGIPVSRLVSPSWFGRSEGVAESRHIQISQIALNMPGEKKIGAIVEIYSDLSGQVKEVYLTQLMLLVLTFSSLSCLNLYLYRGLKQNKKKLEFQLAKHSKASHKADHDALTGLPNRTLLIQRLKQAVARSDGHQHSIVVMFLDLDGFKEVNDTLGHHTGDQLLKIVARRLKECVREGDTASRLGGDEFVLVLPMFDSRYSEPVSETAQRVLDSVSMPMNLRDRKVQLGCSIGVSRSPSDGKNADTLLKNADSAMYQAKEQGRNNVQFYSHNLTTSLSASNLNIDLTQSLHRQEFHLLYQPQLELKSDTIAGVSVFLHWLHPVAGMKLADKLLPSSKKNCQALAVGVWMLKSACVQRMTWQQKGINCGPLTVYINAKFFQFEILDETVRDILEGSHLKPKNLELELSDCLLNQNLEAALSVLNRLKSLGVRLSIDATQLSPNFIRQLPLDSLRIGHNTIRKVMTNGTDSVIARAIIGLGRQLYHPVIAEGVATIKQKEYLRTKGCDQIQGLCIGTLLPSHEATEFLQTYIKTCTIESSSAKSNADTDQVTPS